MGPLLNYIWSYFISFLVIFLGSTFCVFDVMIFHPYCCFFLTTLIYCSFWVTWIFRNLYSFVCESIFIFIDLYIPLCVLIEYYCCLMHFHWSLCVFMHLLKCLCMFTHLCQSYWSLLCIFICLCTFVFVFMRGEMFMHLCPSLFTFFISYLVPLFFTFIHHFHLCSSLFAFIHLCSSLCVFIHLHSSQTSGFVFTHLYAKHLYSTFSHHPSSLVIDIYV